LDTVVADPRQTVASDASSALNRNDAAPEGAMTPQGADSLARRVVLRQTLGEGGMGIVRLATQRSLHRDVVVKSIKPGQSDNDAAQKLLREAWVTGSLEHPNIVPVYDLAIDADGAPVMVLKRIEGKEWAEYIDNADAVREQFGADDLFLWNLQVLMQVCNAVRFAHSRGVLHRDLKPENVMIGAFGEVYLVDWGLAVAIRDDGTGRLPLASDATEFAGTPLYMAPEMLGGAGAVLSEQTDVYLLGAVLYELVTGQPPHRGERLVDIVMSIQSSPPALSDDVPAQLASTIRSAMRLDPSERLQGAEQLRLALQTYLTHRDGAKLAHVADTQLGALTALAARQDPADLDDPGRMYRLFDACRFGFRHALEVWPENAAAREGLDRALTTMLEHELARNEPEAAHALFSELSAPTEQLAQRVEHARNERRRHHAKLEELSDDLDLMAGSRIRARVAWAVGGLLAGSPFAAALNTSQHWFPMTKRSYTATMGVILLMIIAIALLAKDTVMRTAVNRRLAAGAIAAIGMQTLFGVGATHADMSYSDMVHTGFLISGGVVWMMCACIDWRLAITACALVGAYVILPFIGMKYMFHVMSVTNSVLLFNLLTLWKRWNTDADGAQASR
jgi:serine/threonine-protein kinase